VKSSTQHSAQAGFYARTREATKILVVDLGFLGDTVHLVPALWEIKRHYPQAAVHVLTTTLGAEMLQLAPCSDHAWAVELHPGKRTLAQQWSVLRSLRREHFDLAFNFSGADRTIFMTALAGARWTITHAAGRDHFWSGWLSSNQVSRRSNELPVYEQRRAVLAACGFELGPARFELSVPESARAWAAGLVPAGAIHLSINASTYLKEWPLTHWIELTRALLQRDARIHVVATGSNSAREQKRLAELVGAVSHPRLRTFAGLTVAQLGALLAHSAWHVGADSGVLHLAAALGVRTVSIFREYPGLKEWLPRGPEHRHRTSPCTCETQVRDSCQRHQIAECLASISPTSVLALLDCGQPTS
jgi:ADP-heptose:LPS heptosyltransferase